MLAVLIVVALLAALAVALQLAIPRIAGRRISAALTEGGGSAEVEVEAFPATRLLRNRGDRLTVRGRDLAIGLSGDGEQAGLKALDGFDEVDVELRDLHAGPFAIAAFVLARGPGQSYALALQGSVTGAHLVRLADALIGGLPAGPVIGAVAAGLPIVSRELPVAVQIELISEPGGLKVGAGGGSIAGYPAGPIATSIAAAVARRLELAPLSDRELHGTSRTAASHRHVARPVATLGHSPCSRQR